MNILWLSLIEIINKPWFWQGIIVNTSFALISMPFTHKMFLKTFRNRKRSRIKNALNELKTYCLQQLIKDKHINKNAFENQLYIIANRYKLDIKDIYNDKNKFGQNLIRTIIEIDLIDNTTKEKLANKIRKDKIFIESDNETSIDENYNSIFFEEENYLDQYDNIPLYKNEKREIFKYTGITTGIIFIALLLYTFVCQVLFEAYGINSIIFINTIIIIISTIPILVNGIMHFAKFNEQNKLYFYFLLIISILNNINFICIVGILIYHKW